MTRSLLIPNSSKYSPNSVTVIPPLSRDCLPVYKFSHIIHSQHKIIHLILSLDSTSNPLHNLACFASYLPIILFHFHFPLNSFIFLLYYSLLSFLPQFHSHFAALKTQVVWRFFITAKFPPPILPMQNKNYLYYCRWAQHHPFPPALSQRLSCPLITNQVPFLLPYSPHHPLLFIL